MIVRDIDELIAVLRQVRNKTDNLPLNPFMRLDIKSYKLDNGQLKTYLHYDKTFEHPNEVKDDDE